MLRRSRTSQKSSGVFQSKDGSGDVAITEQLEGEINHWLGVKRAMFGEVLLQAGIIDADQLTAALAYQQEHGGLLGEVLGLPEQIITDALGAQFHIKVADLRNESPSREALDLIGEELARRHRVLPFSIDEDGRSWIVTVNPRDDEAIRALTEACGRVGLLLGNGSDIDRLIDQEFNVLQQASVYVQAHQLTEHDVTADDPDVVRVDENAPVVQVVNRIVTQGVRSRASDVHIEAQEKGIRVRYRVDGVLTDAISLPLSMGAAISSRIKVMAELNIVERRRPQDGQFSVVVDDRPIDVRTSVVATVHGEKIVLRLLDKQRSLIGLSELGMPEELIKDLLRIVKAPLGMLLVTGPTGSGKTTTLYATLTEVNDPTKNVVTVEDPVEYQFAGINQMQISEAAGISFADGLRGILRQDPDTILVGEIRDIETARIAMQAALTGHFVLSSLHAVDSVAAVHRFTDMGLEPFLVASAVSGVMAQRLLRRNCPSCTVEYRPSPDRVRLVAAQIGTAKATFKQGEGCNMCGFTGYRGRVGVYELLPISDSIRQHIVDKATHTEMRKTAVAEGMKTMQVQAFQMVADGTTTVDEVIRSVYAPGVELEVSPIAELMPATRELETGADELEVGGAGNDVDDRLVETDAHPLSEVDIPSPVSEDASDSATGLQAVEGGR